MRAFFVLLLVVFACSALAQPQEHEAKAAFLLQFLAFVEFPREVMPPEAPLVVGVVGGEAFAAVLQRIVAGRSVDGRRVLVRRLGKREPPAGVHLVFFAKGEAARLGELQRRAPAQPLLIVCEWDGALEQGAVVNFLRSEDRVRFEVALEHAERRGLRISPRMLAVAQSVKPARR